MKASKGLKNAPRNSLSTLVKMLKRPRNISGCFKSRNPGPSGCSCSSLGADLRQFIDGHAAPERMMGSKEQNETRRDSCHAGSNPRIGVGSSQESPVPAMGAFV